MATSAFAVMTKPMGEEPYRMMYLNAWETVPPKLVTKELGMLLLEVLTLLHSMRSQRLGFWFGFTLFGLVLEIIGYVNATHFHAQFLVQFIMFLPLKELLVYPLLMYPSWIAVEKLGLPEIWQCAAVMGIVLHFGNMPYDGFCARPGFGWSIMDPSFEFANFDPSQWHGGIAAVYYGWLTFNIASGSACAYARNRALSGASTALVVGASSLLSCVLWGPYHCMKLISCSNLWSKPFPSGSPTLWYVQCVRNAALTDGWCWVLTLGAVLCAAYLALRYTGGRTQETSSISDWPVLLIVCLYFSWVVVLYAMYDDKPWGIVPVWFCHGLVASSLHIACHAYGRSLEPALKKKS